MMWKTHLVFGILCGLLVMNVYDVTSFWIFFPLVILGSLLPDIDERHSKINQGLPVFRWLSVLVKHRGIFHSIFMATGLAVLLYWLVGMQYAMPLFVGYMSHLLIDSLTKSGINFLHPVSQFRISGFVETGSILETFVFLGISAGIVFILV